jgi:hypothetical protein
MDPWNVCMYDDLKRQPPSHPTEVQYTHKHSQCKKPSKTQPYNKTKSRQRTVQCVYYDYRYIYIYIYQYIYTYIPRMMVM